MTNPRKSRKKQPSISEILAQLPPKEREIAEDNFRRYLQAAILIYEAALEDPERKKKLDELLGENGGDEASKGEVSKPGQSLHNPSVDPLRDVDSDHLQEPEDEPDDLPRKP